ncbi:MAG: cupin domain-containing protein, partial [Burkholderiales bacterium]
MNAISSLNREDAYSAVEPYINAEGVHLWPFDPLFPVDVHFFTLDGPGNIRMNRHDYFELALVLSGEAVFQIQERSLPVREGDLFVMGSNLYHTLRRLPRRKFEAVFFFFEPGLVRAAESSGDDLEYLMPFSLQDSDFPHIIPPETGIPAQSLDLIQRIWSELPAESNRARLTVRTYIKTILISLVNHYATYRDTREKFLRKEEAFERLRPLFEFVDRHYQQTITVKDAARLSAMSASSFERFFKSTA